MRNDGRPPSAGLLVNEDERRQRLEADGAPVKAMFLSLPLPEERGGMAISKEPR